MQGRGTVPAGWKPGEVEENHVNSSKGFDKI